MERYRHGYSVGAGAVVLCGERVLLVRLGYGPHQDMWTLPGGYAEPGETVDVTIQREVLEETGVSAEVQGLIAVRSRVMPGENSMYLVFLLRTNSEEVHADGQEVLAARFLSLDEVRSLSESEISPMSLLIVTRALEGNVRLLEQIPVPAYPASEFVLFM